MDKKEIIEKARLLRKQVGGFILGFPIEDENPFSEYAVVVYEQGKYFVFPQANNLQLAAVGINTLINSYEKTGKKIKFKRDVRLISYEAQINAPDITTRRIRNNGHFQIIREATP
jgi:hypothetical protein